jgi:hypothetical protein
MNNFLLAINFIVSKMEHIPCCMLYFYCHNILRDENKKKGTNNWLNVLYYIYIFFISTNLMDF